MDLLSARAAMRPFGRPADLEVDFGAADRPGLVTSVLAQCAEESDPAHWWSQPVGARTAALLRLVAATEARETATLQARCVGAACGELFEFELPLRGLPGEDAGNEPIRVRLDETRSLTLRRPTGSDLRRWREARPASRADALRAMFDALVLDGRVESADEPMLAASIEAVDPLVSFGVACVCPACGAASEVPVDLEALALGRLAAHQRELLRQVHRLASHYGWTEAEVLAVPPARRASYLALIEAEG
jgi:hypothetical protein